ncbi:MAG: TldD/PmbA family protein [Candidatus Thorarchaeota archaeon]|jgi:TldD protein
MGRAIEGLSDNDVSFADIRQESLTGTQLTVVNGDLRTFSQASKSGSVARALVGESWGQASTTEALTKERLERLLSDATRMAKATSKYARKRIDLSEVPPIEKRVWQKVKEDPVYVSTEDKLDFVMELDRSQKVDDRIVNVNSTYMDTKRVNRLVNTVGTRLEWDELRVRSMVNPVAREGDRMQFDYDSISGLQGFEMIRNIDASEFASKPAEGAIKLLSASKPPSGKLKVVIDGDLAGVVAHEVCGHGSEADEVVKGRSFLSDMVDKQVGTELVSMVDDGTIKGKYGTIPFDSEGTPTSRTMIIDKGVYAGYLHTIETAAIMGVRPTGNGRAQDYNRRIFARMTNTFFDKGDWSDEEIISDTKDGVYVIKSLSGMEDVVGGGVQVTALKGYVIKNGELSELVRSMALAGKVLDILTTVDAVGMDLKFSGGTCGKGEEDWAPVTSGGPHMRAEMIVGGG